MHNIEKEIEEKFGGRLRLRVNGVLIEDGKILLVKHQMSQDRAFWSVPGGGMEYGTDASDNLKREFREETGLEVEVGEFLFVHEFLEPPLHAVELFFEVRIVEGNLGLGVDPELAEDKQILSHLGYFSLEQLSEIPKLEKHRLFWELNSLNDIRMWEGYFNFGNKCIK